MATSWRTFRLYEGEITGISNKANFPEEFMTSLAQKPKRFKLVLPYGRKKHLLESAKKKNERLQMVFVSYALGDRSDVINTDDLSIEPSPLRENQANVTYTHVLSWQNEQGKALFLLESINTGIGHSALSNYSLPL